MNRVLIVAAYTAVRAGLHALLCEAGDMEVLGAVSGSEELERLLPAIQPEIIIYDENAEEGTRLLDLLADTDIGLVVLSDESGAYQRLAAAPLRGWAYLRKEAEGAEIASAVRAVTEGLIVLDRTFASSLAERTPANQGPITLLSHSSGDPLTTREQQVLQLMALGLPNKQIGARLTISLSTVKFHVASILTKLGASSRTEAVTTGARQGLVSL